MMGCPDRARMQVMSPHSLVAIFRATVAREIRMDRQSFGEGIDGEHLRRDFNSDEDKCFMPV